MKNAILILDSSDSNCTADSIIDICENLPIDGMNFYVACTREAADKMLSERDDISAVIFPEDGQYRLEVLRNNKSTSVSSIQKRQKPGARFSDSKSDIEKMLSVLDKHGMLQSPGKGQYCAHHLSNAACLTELKTKMIRIDKDIEDLFDEVKAVRDEIASCPLKASFLKKGMSNGADKAVLGNKTKIALIGLAGVILTAVMGLLSKLFEVLFTVVF